MNKDLDMVLYGATGFNWNPMCGVSGQKFRSNQVYTANETLQVAILQNSKNLSNQLV